MNDGIPSKKLLVAALAFIAIYQTVLMVIWNTYPAWDWTLVRFSLSNADAITIFALAMAFYSYYRLELLQVELMPKKKVR